VAMLIAVAYVLINLLADFLVLLLVPKLREPA
jgi:ABC-type dipeptide/oligopeptide/nickel transport system permease component